MEIVHTYGKCKECGKDAPLKYGKCKPCNSKPNSGIESLFGMFK